MVLQRPKFTSAVGNCRGFCRGKLCFNSNHRGKKIAEVIIPSKIYVQFTIFSTYFSTKFLFTDKRYHLHVLDKCLDVLQKVRSITYFRHFIHPLSLRLRGSGASFAFTSYIILSAKFYDVTLKQLLFCLVLLPFVHLPAPKKDLWGTLIQVWKSPYMFMLI